MNNSHQLHLLHFTVYGTSKAIGAIGKPEDFIFYCSNVEPFSARDAYVQARTGLYAQGREHIQITKVTWTSNYGGEPIVIEPDEYLEG